MRVTLPDGIGPALVEGPVEVVLPDGSVRESGRPVVALCLCRRSRRYPFCDTSHRRRSLPPAEGRGERGAVPMDGDGGTSGGDGSGGDGGVPGGDAGGGDGVEGRAQ